MDNVESTPSLWKPEHLAPRAPLRADVTCDVCVVGAGIAGLSAAYHLSREGRRVIVLDAHDVGGGETAQTTAHLASALDDRFAALVRVYGSRGARLAYESHARAIDEIEAAIEREGIDAGFARVDGYLFLGPRQDEQLLEEELRAARRIGFPGVDRAARAPLDTFDTGPCLVFPRQARLHPLRYLAGIAAAIERGGGTIHAQTRATRVRGGSPAKVSTSDGFEVRARAVIVATNSPFHLRLAVHSKQAPYRSYAIALRVPRGAVPDALYWDTCDPYHYVRLAPESPEVDLLIVGGEDQRTATSDDAAARYRRLETWARERFPVASALVHRWSGQVLEPYDHLAFIGEDPSGERNVYIATGDSGHGLTHGALAGVLLADLVAGRRNPWRDLYAPSRKTVRAAPTYARDNLEVAEEYAKWLTPERRRRDDVLAPGEGAVVQRGARRLAMYRDLAGVLHQHSAVCTHLGCVVRWNSDAKSWDCRCHGSRFAPTGEVLNGPAVRPLAAVDERSSRAGRTMSAGRVGGVFAAIAVGIAVLAVRGSQTTGRRAPANRLLARRLASAGLRRGGGAAAIANPWTAAIAVGALFGVLLGVRTARLTSG